MERTLTPGYKRRGAHVAKDKKEDVVKIWFFSLLPLLVIAVGGAIATYFYLNSV